MISHGAVGGRYGGDGSNHDCTGTLEGLREIERDRCFIFDNQDLATLKRRIWLGRHGFWHSTRDRVGAFAQCPLAASASPVGCRLLGHALDDLVGKRADLVAEICRRRLLAKNGGRA